MQFGRKYAKSCAVNGERLSCEKPQAVDQSNSFRQFDESFDPRAAHVSLSSKSLRRRSRREFATQSSPGSRARSPCRPPQRAKFPYMAFLFVSFFFAPTRSKKKRTNAFVQFLFDAPFVYNLGAARWKFTGWRALQKKGNMLPFAALQRVCFTPMMAPAKESRGTAACSSAEIHAE